MSFNLTNRILTSLILLMVLLICLFLSKFLWLYLLLVVSIISFFEFNNLIKKKFKNNLNNKSKIFFYNVISIAYLIIFVFIGYELHKNSSIYLFFILSLCAFSDTGGYIVGKIIGGKKLTKISPNKTISGSFGSFIFSMIPLLILLNIFSEYNSSDFINEIILKDTFYLVYICLLLSLLCQLGDLFISYFKRQAKVKDTGSILPGHGGLLDRIDGLIFVLPTAYLLKLTLI